MQEPYEIIESYLAGNERSLSSCPQPQQPPRTVSRVRRSSAQSADAFRRLCARRSDGQPPFPEWDARHLGPHGYGSWCRGQRPGRQGGPEREHRCTQCDCTYEETFRFIQPRESRREARRVRSCDT